jgi:hypothetical protein
MTTAQDGGKVVMKSGNLKFLEPSGPHQACNGTAVYVIIKTQKYGNAENLNLLIYIYIYVIVSSLRLKTFKHRML